MSADPRLLVRPAPPAPAVERPMVWTPCPRCWSQRYVLHAVKGHPGLHSRHVCERCGGLGEVGGIG